MNFCFFYPKFINYYTPKNKQNVKMPNSKSIRYQTLLCNCAIVIQKRIDFNKLVFSFFFFVFFVFSEQKRNANVFVTFLFTIFAIVELISCIFFVYFAFCFCSVHLCFFDFFLFVSFKICKYQTA